MSVPDAQARQASRRRNSLLLLIGLVCLIAAGKPILADTMDPDCFWHLRVAEQLRQQITHGSIGPIVDNLSFASIREPWTPYSWLAELGMESLWIHAGWRAAVLLHALCNVAFILLVACSCYCMVSMRAPRSKHVEGTSDESTSCGVMETAFASVAAMILSLAYMSFRPVTAALVLLALCGWLIVRDRRHCERTLAIWLLIPLTALIINLHLYAIFIPMWVSALWLGALWERHRAKPHDRSDAERCVERYSWLLAGCGLACLATPMLPGVVMTALHYQSNDPMVASGVIKEMLPFYRGFGGIVSAAIVLVMMGCAIVNRGRLRAGECLWLGLSTALLFRLGRFSPAFAIVAAPIFAMTLPRMSDRIVMKPAVRFAMIAILLLGLGRLVLTFPRGNTSFDAWLERPDPQVAGYPCKAAKYLATEVKPTTRRVINEFTWGGFLEWRLQGQYQMLLDGRTQLYSSDFWHATYLGSESDRAAYLSKVHADAALLPCRNSVFEKTLLDQGWQVAYKDERAEVLVPPASDAGNKSNSKWPFATIFLGE